MFAIPGPWQKTKRANHLYIMRQANAYIFNPLKSIIRKQYFISLALRNIMLPRLPRILHLLLWQIQKELQIFVVFYPLCLMRSLVKCGTHANPVTYNFILYSRYLHVLIFCSFRMETVLLPVSFNGWEIYSKDSRKFQSIKLCCILYKTCSHLHAIMQVEGNIRNFKLN